MNDTIRFSALFASSLLIFACEGVESSSSGAASSGASTGAGGTGLVGSLPCDVNEVLAKNCQSCHSDPPKFGAPMPLVTYTDLTAPALSDAKRKVFELVGERIHDDTKPMPQPPNEALSDAELKTIDGWIAAAAPSSKEECGSGTGGAGGGTPSLACKPDIHLKSSTPWVMPKDTDDIYVCYGVDITPQSKSQLIGFAPRVDNKTIVHHILLLQSESPVSADPTPCSFSGIKDSRIIAVWAPGGEALELPPDVGLPMEGTAHYVVQIHYSNLTHLDGQTDTSGYDLCSTTELRPNEGDILAFGTTDITIPAAGSLDITCDFKVPAQFPEKTVISGMPHMHKLGTTMSTVKLPAGGGEPVDLGTREVWNFDSQTWTDLQTTIKGGDTVRTRCAWNNPGAMPVSFGEDTSDEMCYSFTLYYPKITTAGWSWALPSALSKCAPTP